MWILDKIGPLDVVDINIVGINTESAKFVLQEILCYDGNLVHSEERTGITQAETTKTKS